MPISVGVLFEVRQAQTRPGEVIHVAGNKPQLGDWMPLPQDDEKVTRSLTTNTFMYPRWFMHMPIWFELENQPEVEPATGPTLDLQYKFVRDRRGLDDGFQVLKWEVSIQNRHLSLPAEDGSIWIISHAMWNNSSDKPQVLRITADELAPRWDALGGFGMKCVPGGYPSGRLPPLVPRIAMASSIGEGTDRGSFGDFQGDYTGRSVGFASQRRGSEEFQLTPRMSPAKPEGLEGAEGLSGVAFWSIEAEFSANFSTPPRTPDRFFGDSGLLSGLSSDSSSEVDEENEQVRGAQHFAVADKASPFADCSGWNDEHDTAFLGGMSPMDRSNMQMREKLEQRRLLLEPRDNENDDTPEETARGNQSLEDSPQALANTTRIFEMCSDDGGHGDGALELSAGDAANLAKTSELVYEVPLNDMDVQDAEQLRSELQRVKDTANVAAKKARGEIIQLSHELGREREHVKVLVAESSKKDDDISDLLHENERLRSVVSEASEQVETLFMQNSVLRDTLEKAKISVMDGDMPTFQAKPPLTKKSSRNWNRTNSLRWHAGAKDGKDVSEPSSPVGSKAKAVLKEMREPQEEPEGPSSPVH